MITRRLFTLAAATVLAGAAFVATPATAQTNIAFTLDWRFEGPAAGFFLAQDRGYFEEEGLNVTIDTGAGSVEAIPRVATGTYQMGFGDINSLIKFLDQDPEQDVRAVMMVYETPTFAVVGRRSLGITEDPKSLEGKTLGAPPPDGAFAQWPIFVAENDIDTSEMTIENIGFPVREPMLVSGQVDAITGFAFSTYLSVRRNVEDPDDIAVFLMADYGVKLYGNAIMVHPEFAEANPEAVEGFLRAFTRGLKDVIADPEGSIAAVLERNPVASEDMELERLHYALENNILTDEVLANGLGTVDMARLAESIEQLTLTYTFTNMPAPEDIFDASYLPPAEDLAVQ